MISPPSFLFILICFALDLIFGDPVYRFHPIRLLGNSLTFLENCLRQIKLDGYLGGFLLFVGLSILSLGSVEIIHRLATQIHPWLAEIWLVYLGYSLIALKDLRVHAQSVANSSSLGDLLESRKRVSMIVGRDTDQLDLAGCNRATIESVSENLADGVIAPLFFLAIFGIPGLVFFKVVSTMDSMVGYQNEKYQYFGWVGAKMDDLLNWIPARLTWLLICGSTLLVPGFNTKKAWVCGWKQSRFLPSPNAGWGQAAAAGALNLRLVGPIRRKGVIAHSEWLGADQDRINATEQDIEKMNQLALVSTFLFLFLVGIFLI